MPRKKREYEVEEVRSLKDWSPEGEVTIEEEFEEPTEELPFSEETVEEPPKPYPAQVKYGLERWQDISAAVELLGTRAVEIENHIATATATVRGGWRFFESDGVMFKLRESDWQNLLA